MKWRDYTLNLIDTPVRRRFLLRSFSFSRPSKHSRPRRRRNSGHPSPNPRQCLPRPRAGPLHYRSSTKLTCQLPTLRKSAPKSLIFSAVRLKKSSQSPAKPVSNIDKILDRIVETAPAPRQPANPTGATRALISTPISMIIAVLFSMSAFSRVKSIRTPEIRMMAAATNGLALEVGSLTPKMAPQPYLSRREVLAISSPT